MTELKFKVVASFRLHGVCVVKIITDGLWCRGTHILRQTGMCGSNGLFFHKKSLNVGPTFYKKYPKYGSVFQKFWANT